MGNGKYTTISLYLYDYLSQQAFGLYPNRRAPCLFFSGVGLRLPDKREAAMA